MTVTVERTDRATAIARFAGSIHASITDVTLTKDLTANGAGGRVVVGRAGDTVTVVDWQRGSRWGHVFAPGVIEPGTHGAVLMEEVHAAATPAQTLRERVRDRLVRDWRESAEHGGDAHAWRLMSTLTTTLTPGWVTETLGHGTAAIADVVRVLDEIAAGRDDATEQITRDQLAALQQVR